MRWKKQKGTYLLYLLQYINISAIALAAVRQWSSGFGGCATARGRKGGRKHKPPASPPNPTPRSSAGGPKRPLGSSSGGGAGTVAGTRESAAPLPPTPRSSAGPPKGGLGCSARVGGELSVRGVKRVRESGAAGAPERPPGVWVLESSTAGLNETRKSWEAVGSNSKIPDLVVISRNPAEDLRSPQGPPVALAPH